MSMQPGDETKLEPQQPAAGQAAGAGQAQPEYVTKDQLEGMFGELKKSFETSYRGVQSTGDRAVSRMQEVQQNIEKMIAGFPGATQDQIKQFSREKALDVLFEQQGTVTGPEQPKQAGDGSGKPETQASDAPNMVDLEAERMVKTYGFDIAESDPEFKIIQAANTANSTPFDFLSAYDQALKAKAARQKLTIPARMPMMATGSSAPANDIANINDPDELFRLARAAGKI